jgi:hypothetical protein
LFTVEEARQALAALLPDIAEFVRLRADAAELEAALATGEPSPHGGRAELKGLAARRDELLSRIAESGADLKGVAPLLLDFPAERDSVPVLLCWVEGEPALAWYHRADLGFLGRRPLEDDGQAAQA